LRPSPQQLASLGRSIVDALVRGDLVELGGDHAKAIASVSDCLGSYFKAAAALEAEAERLADEHLRAAGRAAVGLDRRRVVQMILARLAKERGFSV
jgi:Protein of unknown function (DUF507)